MTQRINLQYSIKLHELEDEVTRLIAKVQTNAANTSDTLSGLHESGISCLTLSTLERIEQFRQNLADMDHTLHDVQNIIKGYLNYKSSEQQEANEIYPTVSEEHLSNLQEKINNFKESLDENPDQQPANGDKGAPHTTQ